MQKLSGKTALITGGSSGIGLAIAKMFLDHDSRVTITSRDSDALNQAQTTLGGRAMTLRCDSSKCNDVTDAMSTLKQEWGMLDVLVVNAAIAGPLPFEAINEAHFDELVSTNFRGAFFTIQKALPLMSAHSSIIVVTSIANQIGSPNFSVYAACKAALRSLVQTLSLELIGRGIRVNAISPGPITTPMWSKFGLPEDASKAIQADVQRKSPSKRFGTPDEVAQVALFLACDDSSYIVGQELVVDGGMSVL